MTPDDLNDSIAAQEPGFGGAFIDDNGNLVVWASDVTRGENIRRQLLRFANLVPGQKTHAAKFAAAHLVVRKSDYSIADLNQWREAIENAAIFHWQATDVDEQENRIWIGVASTSDIAIVRNAATSLNIPQNALDIEPVTVKQTSAQYLNGSSVSPIAAGVGAYFGPFYSTASNYCTIGMVDTIAVAPPGTSGLASRGFITAYHCLGEADYGWAKLLTSGGTYDSLGRGQLPYFPQDPHSMNPNETKQGWTCPSPGYNCTFADVVQFYVDSSIATKRGYMAGNVNTTVTYGVIAPTIDSVSGFQTGSLQIDSTKSIEMQGENGSFNMFVGDAVHKIGAGSGHTYGTITRSCVSVVDQVNAAETFRLFCQMIATYGSTDGDSGAPVYYNPSVPYYEGLQWGRVIEPGFQLRSIFSPSDFVHMALNNATKFCFYCNLY